jgi:hypothetical protein
MITGQTYEEMGNAIRQWNSIHSERDRLQKCTHKVAGLKDGVFIHVRLSNDMNVELITITKEECLLLISNRVNESHILMDSLISQTNQLFQRDGYNLKEPNP